MMSMLEHNNVACVSHLRFGATRILNEFMNGHFIVQRSLHKFSLIWKHQSHEQSNEILQSNGGISDLYDNPDAIALHMLSAPDSACNFDEFENICASRDQSTAHHEEAPSLQIKFTEYVFAE